jgi:hypothetical protein
LLSVGPVRKGSSNWRVFVPANDRLVAQAPLTDSSHDVFT